jgi:hypothetical protein
MTWDPVRQRALLFGGEGGGNQGDTWEYAPATATWTLRATTGPTARAYSCMAFDTARMVTVLFGGYISGTHQGDTWEWDGSAWTRRFPTNSPPARWFYGCWFDQARGRVNVFGGSTTSGVVIGDVWEWDGTNWSQRTLTGGPMTSAHSVAYEPNRQRMVLFGGYNPTVSNVGTWELGTTWMQMNPSTPPNGTYGASVVFDGTSGTVVMVGGITTSSSAIAGAWSYDGSSWTALSSNVGPRSHGGMVFDPIRGKLIHFGGITTGSTPVGETWEY